MSYLKNLISTIILIISCSSLAIEKKYDVVGIGKAMVDIVSFVTEEELKEFMPKDFRKSDSNKIDSKFASELFKKLKQYEVIPGGSEANVIVNIASLGGKTAFNTIAASDKFGLLFKESLQKEGVSYLSKLNPFTEKSTALCFTFITPDKDRTFAVSSSLTNEINESYINFESIKESKLFYTDSSNFDHGEIKSQIINKAFKIAKENSTEIAFNLNNKFHIEKNREEILDHLKDVSIFISSGSELQFLFGSADVDSAIEEVLKHVKIAVLTMGKDGALVVTKDSRISIPSYAEQSKIVDLNGAGDAFAAGFLYGYISGFDLEKSGIIGAKTAAAIITQVGARPRNNLAKLVLN